MAHELDEMAKKIAVQTEVCIFSEKNQMSAIAFLQELRSEYDTGGIQGGAAVWLFNQFSKGEAMAAVKVRVALESSANFHHEGAIKSYSSIVHFLLKHYVTDGNIARLDAVVRGHR